VDTLGCERGLVLVWTAWLLSFLPVGRKLIYNKLQNVLYDIALKKEKKDTKSVRATQKVLRVSWRSKRCNYVIPASTAVL